MNPNSLLAFIALRILQPVPQNKEVPDEVFKRLFFSHRVFSCVKKDGALPGQCMACLTEMGRGKGWQRTKEKK